MRLAAERAAGSQKEEVALFLWFSCTNRISSTSSTNLIGRRCCAMSEKTIQECLSSVGHAQVDLA